MERESLTESDSESIQPDSMLPAEKENREKENAEKKSGSAFEKIAPQDRKFECSTSLTLVQIVEKFREQSEEWELETHLGKVKGRTYGTGEPVYFLNGAGAGSLLYSTIAWLLKDHYKCVLFDSPLYFPETCKRKEANINSLSEVVKEISDFHHDRNVSLYASSFGSMVALNSLALFPDRFSRGLLQGGYSHRELSLFERTLSSIGRKIPGPLKRVPFYKKIQTMNHRLWLPLMDQGRWEFYQKHSGEIPIKTLADQVRMISKTDLRNSIAKIQQPVLIIRTEGEGSVLGKCQEELEKNLPNGKTEWIHSCGLIPYISRPHAIAKLIRNYV